MFTTNSIRQSINSLISECFGSFDYLESIVTPSQLFYIYNFPYDIVIYKVWENYLDLVTLGKASKAEYKILDDKLNLIHKVYFSDNLNSYPLNLEYISNIKHGGYFHISYKEAGEDQVILIWVVKELPLKTKQKLASNWAQLTNQYKPNYYKLGNIEVKKEIAGWLQVYYLPGKLQEVINASDLINNPNSQLILSSKANTNLINLTLNGWYGFYLIGEDRVYLLKLTNLNGVGLNRVHEYNGLTFLSQDNSTNSNNRVENTKISLMADLDFALDYVSYNLILSLPNKISYINPSFTYFNGVNISIINMIQNKLASYDSEIVQLTADSNVSVDNIESKVTTYNTTIANTVLIDYDYVDYVSTKQLSLA